MRTEGQIGCKGHAGSNRRDGAKKSRNDAILAGRGAHDDDGGGDSYDVVYDYDDDGVMSIELFAQATDHGDSCRRG